jgi:competence protein ComFA
VAAPRSDVIIELERRFTQVFLQTPKAILYGDSPTPYSYAPLVLTTLHQLRRFQQAFDLIMIDEVDAFPFHGNAALRDVLKRALKPGASQVFVTATPTREMKASYLQGRLKGIHLPIRFHRATLPEPKDQWVGNWRAMLAKGIVPRPLLKWIQACLDKRRVIFLFVPDKKTLSRLVNLLKKKQFSVEGAHSEDPERREKVLAFREGKHSIMVATTILERGVTVPFAAVGILGAETALFDERALVQMAGRAGRDARDPEGEVVFFHYGKTREMARAHAHIRFMNKEGAKANERLTAEERAGGEDADVGAGE